MAITLRAIKETALTYKEMDRNFSSFFYSASQDATTLKLWYTGSNLLNGSGESYDPSNRFISINLQTSTAPVPVSNISIAGTQDGEIQFKSGDALGANGEFRYLTSTGLLGVGTSSPLTRLHVKGNSTTPALLRLESHTTGTTVKRSTLEFYQGTQPIGAIGRDNSLNNNIYIKTNQSDGKLVFNIGSLTNESALTTTGLGIGTISPQKALHVVGEGLFSKKVSIGDNAGTEALKVYQESQLEGNTGDYQHIANFSIIPLNSKNNINITAVRTTAGITSTTSGMRIQQLIDFSYMGYLQFGGTNNVEGISIGTGGSTEGPLGSAIVERFKITAGGAVTINKTLNIGETLTVGTVATATATNTSTVVVSAAGLVQKIDAAPVPKGGIIMWSGTVAPPGWALCNGGVINGLTTPNLVDRFVVGANGAYPVQSIGGSANAVLIGHTHATTAVINPNPHSHGIPLDNAGSNNITTITAGYGNTPNSDEAVINSLLATTSLSVEVTNPATGKNAAGTDNAGQLGTNANLPPYYALAYIMYGGIV